MRKILIIPCHNCEIQITRLISKMAQVKLVGYLDSVLFLVNPGNDQTEKAIAKIIHNLDVPAVILLNAENYGLGGSFKLACEYSIKNSFESFIFFHGDDQASVDDIIPMIQEFELQGYSCLLGSRFMEGSSLSGYSKKREFANRFLNVIFSIALKRTIYDIGSGLNIYRVNSLPIEKLKLWGNHIAFDINILFHYTSRNNDLRMGFYPISWSEEDQKSNANNLFVTIKILKMLFLKLIGKDEVEKTINMRSILVEPLE